MVKVVSPILGIIGATLLTIAGFVAFGVQALLQIAIAPLTFADIGLDPMLLTVSAILTLVWGLLGLVGAILAFTGKKMGVYLMLIAGGIATVGMFIPIGTYTLLFVTIAVNMNSSMFFVDPILLLLGGILGLALKDE